jgi:hypothetical protein
MRRTSESSAHPKNRGSVWDTLFTLAVTAIPAEVAAACVFQLPVTLGADADHVGHDGAGDGLLLGVNLRGVFAHCAR